MNKFLYIIVITFFLSACNGPSDKTPVYGTVDTSAIAADTTIQKAIENTYEYHNTIVMSPKLVYDVLGVGKSKARGEYLVIKRFNEGERDTLIRRERRGPILKTFVADIDGNKNNEIYLVTDTGNLILFGVEEWNDGDPILIELAGADKLKPELFDSIYYDDNAIVVRSGNNAKFTYYYFGAKKGSALQLTKTTN